MELTNSSETTYNLKDLGEVTVSYTYKSSFKNRPKLNNTQKAYEVLKCIFDKDKIGLQEQFVAVFLNNSNIVIGCCNLFSGTINSTLVDIKLLTITALKLMANGVIISHNHPSGNLNPSSQDITLSKNVKNALEKFDILLLDHIIITPFDEYISLKENGNL